MNDVASPLPDRPRIGRKTRRGLTDPVGLTIGFERLENRCVMSEASGFAVGAVTLPVDPTVQVSGSLAQAGNQQYYQVTLDAQGLLVAGVHAPAVDTLLSLEDSNGKVLIQGEATSPTNPDNRVAQHLPAGIYFLAVSDKAGAGGFGLSTTFTQTNAPGEAVGEGQGAYGVTTADLNGDGKPDLILPQFYDNQILINFGAGDGTFQPPVSIAVGSGPREVLAADLEGDGRIDLAVVDQLSNDIMILQGDGQGNFQVTQVLTTRSGPVAVVAGDFSGDGRLDLAVADSGANGVEIFHNQGDGTFAESSFIGSISNPSSLAVADLNGDGQPGLVVASGGSGSLFLLDGTGDDQFAPLPYQLSVGPNVSDVIAANFSGQARPELAAVSPSTGLVSVFGYDGSAYQLRETLKAGATPEVLVAADFNGDGRLDLAVANYISNNVSVFPGNGDATFGASTLDSTGSGPIGLATADFTGDGSSDLVTSDFIGLTVSVLLNNGNATFHSPPITPPSAGPDDLITADVNGDGNLDLLIPEFGLNEVAVFLGRGDGTFREPIEIPAGSGPNDLIVGDFTGDHVLDMAVVDYFTNTLEIFKGNGDGTFEPIQTMATGEGPEYIKTADLDGDGHLDLVVANYLGNDIDIYYGRGDGTFADHVSYPVGLGPGGIAISDLNGDGRPDIAIADSASDDVDVLLSNGPRSFAAPISYPAGAQPWEVTAADFNKDGHPDLIVADGLSTPSVVSLLVNNGDGTFGAPEDFGVGGSPYPVAVGDFNGDGNLDVVTGNDNTNDLSVLLGNGNGTFQPEIRLPAGLDPYGVVTGDFNRDGHLDIIDENYQSGDLTIYTGNGDGTFQGPSTIPLLTSNLPTITANLEGNGVPQVLVANPQAGTITVFNSQGDGTLQLLSTIQVGGSPSGMVVGDFNGDGRPDLAVTDSASGEVLILLGLGDGTFQAPIRYAVGKSPRSPVVGDFKHNGILDIAVADTNSNTVSILMGNGDGTFLPDRQYPVGGEPTSLVIGDVNGDGYLDLGSIDRSSHDLSELIGEPGGNFVDSRVNLAGITPSAFLAADFNGDGQPDLLIGDQTTGRVYIHFDIATEPNGPLVPVDVGTGRVFLAAVDLYHNGQSDLIVANVDTNVVTIFAGWANNTFKNKYTFSVDVSIAGLAVVDLNQDGLPDILITQAGTGEVRTYLSSGNGVFAAAESAVPLPHPSPIVFPISSGVSDIVNIDNSGKILDRVGRVGAVASFGAPINETNGTGISIRDFAIVQTGGIPDVASLDARLPVIYLQKTNVIGPAGVTIIQLPGEGNYTRLVSGDLFGDGLDDLVVIDRSSDRVIIFRQTSPGVFSQFGDPLTVGFGPTDVTLANLNPGGLPDLVVADGSSGDVTLVSRDSQGGFAVAAILPAGLAAAGSVLLPDGLKRTSPDEPVGVASGVFGPSGLADVAVVDRGSDQLSILQGLPDGGLSAPSLALTYQTGLDPIQVVAVPLSKDGLVDLIVLNEGSHDISIFLNNGHGGFTVMARVDAGDNPTSMAVRDVTGDGVPDLVVSNANGDILILSGNGDGTFQPYQRADGTVNLAVGDLTGNGQTDFVLSNTSQDLLTVQTSSSSPAFNQGRGDGLLAPGPVAIADMNGDGIPDLIVTNSGGNDVFVYLGLGKGQFASPQRFFTGTDPVGLTVADLNINGLPDLVVANAGSNDVTILLGVINPDGTWTMVPGPRLKAGDRPVSTTVANVFGDGDGDKDIVVVNQDDNTITVLRGLGRGFFDDSQPLTLATGLSPVEAFVGHFSASDGPGLVILDSQSNAMTIYSTINAAPLTISSGGIDPVSGVMGDFNNDGYSDLAVANNGDSRIALFSGGPNGLTLTQSITLGSSVNPTDLVVSGTKGGVVQFFVGAAGQDHAISVVFASISTISVVGQGLTDNGLSGSGGAYRSITGNGSSSGGIDTAVSVEIRSFLGSQPQESAQASSQTAGGAGGAGGAVTSVITTLTQAVQPFFIPSSRTIGWLLDNIASGEQGQTAEILPLGKNEMAAVAVLLSGSSMTSRLEESGMPGSPVPTEDDAPILVEYIPDDSATNPPSKLDRFVANLGGDPVDFTEDFARNLRQGRDFGPEWVWHRRPTDASGNTASFDLATETTLATRQADRAPEIESRGGRDPVRSGDGQTDLLEVSPASTTSRLSAVVSAVVALTVGVIIARRLQLRVLGDILTRRGRNDRYEQLMSRDGRSERVGSTWLNSKSNSKSRALKDLPPWLQGPMSTRKSRSLADRSFAGSFLRKRSLDR